MSNLVFFDLETQYLYTDLNLDRRDPKSVAQLRLAIAGVLVNGRPSFFTEDEVDNLFQALIKADTIVGHNLVRFDYIVLKPYFDYDIHTLLGAKTLDIMREIDKKTRCWTGLNSLCKLNLGMTKNEDTLNIPKLWREGKHEEVRRYLLNDLKMTEALYNYGKKYGKLKYEHKEYGESWGIREVSVEW